VRVLAFQLFKKLLQSVDIFLQTNHRVLMCDMTEDSDWSIVSAIQYGLDHALFEFSGTDREDLVFIWVFPNRLCIGYPIQIQANQVGQH